MRMNLAKVAVTAALVALAPLAVASAQGMMPAGVKVDSTSIGPTLVTATGMTLYTTAADTVTGKSTCNAQCATNWPPLAATADATPMGDWTIITRDDGTKQWAYKGMPLYTYKNDMKAGDVMGNGRGKWKAATP